MNEPYISVVLATQNPGDAIVTCLESLRRQSSGDAAEVIVADSSIDGTPEKIRNQFPDVRLLQFEKPMGLPELLREALRAGRGRILAVTDPYCSFPADWIAKLRRAHDCEFQVIGGAVENGKTDSLLNWAYYFADYGPFMLPAERHTTRLLAGNHASYKREVIADEVERMPQGFWKVFFHWQLEQRRIPFLFEPDLVIHYARPRGLGDFLRGYFEHGWFFAGLRCRSISAAERILRALTSPLLVLVLFYRRVRDVARKRRHLGKLVLSLPLLLLFCIFWAAGEFVGYAAGRPPAKVYE